LDGFISEWNLIHETLSFDFSNFLNIENESGSFENGSQFYLNSKTGPTASESSIFYKLNDNLDDKVTPIKNLISFTTNTPFWINKIVTKFNYSFDDIPGIKIYETTSNNNVYVYDKQDIDFNDKTIYDETKNEIVTSLNGTDGFYIPKKSNGYLELLINITQNDNTRVYRFTRNFNFIGDEHNKNIKLKEIYINDLTNFERMEF
jgi:hypothetical protein